MKVIQLFITSMLCLFTLAPHLSLASCVPLTDEEKLDNAEVVVEAVITQIDVDARTTTLTATVEKTIKGDVNETVTFVTSSGSTVVTSVDVSFEEGARYKLFLYRDSEGQLTTNTCTGTVALAASTEGTRTIENSDNKNITVVAILIGVVVFAAAAVLIKRFRSTR